MTESWTTDNDYSLFPRTYQRTQQLCDGVAAIQLHRERRVPTRAVYVDKQPADPTVFANSRIIAISGDNELVRWLCTNPDLPAIEVLGLHEVMPELLEQLANAPILGQLRRLVTRGSLAWSKLLSARFPKLETVVVLDPQQALGYPVVPVATMPALRELRLRVSYPGPTTTLADVDQICRSIAGPLETLEFNQLEVPIDTLAGNPALANLRTLVLQHCTLRGAELLCGFGELRVVQAYTSNNDVARALAGCGELEEVLLSGADVTDEAARALAVLGKLRVLSLEDTAIRDAGVLALERSPALANLRELKLEAGTLQTLTMLALAGSPRECFRKAVSWWSPDDWAPTTPKPTGDCSWPGPPPGVARIFVDEYVEYCTTSNCNGAGWGSEGHCPYHMDPELHERSAGAAVHPKIVASTQTLADIEQRCVSLLDDLHELGVARPLREIRWHYREGGWLGPHVPPPFDRLVLLPEHSRHADTTAWPYVYTVGATHREISDASRRSIANAVALLDHGARILRIEDATIDLLWRPTERDDIEVNPIFR